MHVIISKKKKRRETKGNIKKVGYYWLFFSFSLIQFFFFCPQCSFVYAAHTIDSFKEKMKERRKKRIRQAHAIPQQHSFCQEIGLSLISTAVETKKTHTERECVLLLNTQKVLLIAVERKLLFSHMPCSINQCFHAFQRGTYKRRKKSYLRNNTNFMNCPIKFGCIYV